MISEEAHILIAEYERSGTLPVGFTADRSAHSPTVQGDKYEIVQIIQNNTVKISYVSSLGLRLIQLFSSKAIRL
jgi:hypothetical protein